MPPRRYVNAVSKPRSSPGVWLLSIVLLLSAPAMQAADTPLPNGVFLVAKPDMADPNFRDTVVLITEPEVGGGPLGVIVNRPTGVRLSEAVSGLGKVQEKFNEIYGGGPVGRDHILYLVRTREPPKHALHVLQDVYLSADRDLLLKIVHGQTKVTAFRAYAGFAGWAPDQLQAEIERDGWYVIKADADTIFAKDPAKLYSTLLHRINGVTARAGELDPAAF
jgi:putative transcriptional regulator